MPEPPRPRPRQPSRPDVDGMYREGERPTERPSVVHAQRTPTLTGMQQPSRWREPGLVETEDPPPSTATFTEEEKRLIFASLARREPHVEVESVSPSSMRRDRALARVLRSIGGPTGILLALAGAASAYLKPTAKPEQVEEIKNTKMADDAELAKRRAATAEYETKMRAVYVCRLNELAKVAKRQGYDLEWYADNVVFEANQIVRNRDGYLEEKPPFHVRQDLHCPDFPTKPAE